MSNTIKAVTRTGRWVNGAGFATEGAYQYDPENMEFIFRVVGSNGLTVPAEQVISLESFRWDTPAVIEVQ